MASSATFAFRAVFRDSKTCAIQPLDETGAGEDRLRLRVVFTDYRETEQALRAAAALVAGLPAAIGLLVPVTVPYPLPLEEPPVPIEFLCRRINDLAGPLQVQAEMEAFIYLCRNPIEAVLRALPPRSVVLIGTRPWWPLGYSRRFARALRSHGHEVILAQDADGRKS